MRFTLYIVLLLSCSLLAQEKKDVNNSLVKTKLVLAIDSIDAYKQQTIKAHSKGDFATFKIYCDAILEIAKANNLKRLEAQALTNLGIYHSNQEELDLAIEKYLESSKMMETLPEDKRSNLSILLNLGNLYNKIKDYDKAQKTMLEVIERSGDVDDTDNFLMAAYIGLGTTSEKKKQYSKSIIYNTKAKDLATTLNRKDVIISSLLNLTDNYLILGDYDKAISICNKILNDFTEDDSKNQKSKALGKLGEALVKKKQYLEALTYLEQANKLATQGGFFETKIKTHRLLSNVFESTGDLKKSLEQQKLYSKTRETYLNTLSKAQRLELENESDEKTALLTEQTKTLNFLTKGKWLFIIICITFIGLFMASLFIYKTRRKRLLNEALELKADKQILTNENDALQDKLKTIAQEVKEELEIKKSNNNYKNSSLSIADQEKYMQQILDFMDAEKPYLNPDIKQSQIADKLNISVHLFSEILNVSFKQNFNNFINLYRVSEAKSLINNPKYDKYKILSIGYEAGFSSKTSFNRVFKKQVGCTPSEYQKKRKIT